MAKSEFSSKGRCVMRKLLLSWLATLLLGALCCAPGQAENGRLLNTNDVLQIAVLYQPELNATARIEPDGTISLPYAGRIKASGLTNGGLAVKIANILMQKGLVKKPEVSVELTSFGHQVSVLGAVGLPGNITLDRPSTITQILARAGGIREEAGAATIVVHTKGRTQRIDARELLEGRAHVGIMLENNDSIYVEPGAVYYLYGYVNKPGQFPINRKDMTVRQAIAAGGGVAPLGSDWWRLKTRRRVNGVIQELPTDLDDVVLPDDTIVVNERIF